MENKCRFAVPFAALALAALMSACAGAKDDGMKLNAAMKDYEKAGSRDTALRIIEYGAYQLSDEGYAEWIERFIRDGTVTADDEAGLRERLWGFERTMELLTAAFHPESLSPAAAALAGAWYCEGARFPLIRLAPDGAAWTYDPLLEQYGLNGRLGGIDGFWRPLPDPGRPERVAAYFGIAAADGGDLPEPPLDRIVLELEDGRLRAGGAVYERVSLDGYRPAIFRVRQVPVESASGVLALAQDQGSMSLPDECSRLDIVYVEAPFATVADPDGSARTVGSARIPLAVIVGSQVRGPSAGSLWAGRLFRYDGLGDSPPNGGCESPDPWTAASAEEAFGLEPGDLSSFDPAKLPPEGFGMFGQATVLPWTPTDGAWLGSDSAILPDGRTRIVAYLLELSGGRATLSTVAMVSAAHVYDAPGTRIESMTVPPSASVATLEARVEARPGGLRLIPVAASREDYSVGLTAGAGPDGIASTGESLPAGEPFVLDVALAGGGPLWIRLAAGSMSALGGFSRDGVWGMAPHDGYGPARMAREFLVSQAARADGEANGQ